MLLLLAFAPCVCYTFDAENEVAAQSQGRNKSKFFSLGDTPKLFPIIRAVNGTLNKMLLIVRGAKVSDAQSFPAEYIYIEIPMDSVTQSIWLRITIKKFNKTPLIG